MTFMPKIDEPSVGDPTRTCGEAIIDAVRAGNDHETAAGWAGIWPETLSRWITRGAKELARMATTNADEPADTEKSYVNLTLQLHHVEAAAEARMTAQWQAHFGRDWHAIERFMAKRWRSKWGDAPKALELSGPGGGPIAVAAAVMSLDEAEAMLAQVEARVADGVAEAEVPALPAGDPVSA